MKSLPKRALIATTLATALVGTFATAIVQASALQPTTTTIAQAASTATPAPTAAPKPERASAVQREQKRAEHQARFQKKMAERQAAFKAELKLTPAQEPAWNAFVARTQPQARPARERMAHEDWAKLTTPQRLDTLQALKTQRDAVQAQRNDAIRGFYAALSAEQQKVFDAQPMAGFQRAGMHRGHGKHHRDHGAHERKNSPV